MTIPLARQWLMAMPRNRVPLLLLISYMVGLSRPPASVDYGSLIVDPLVAPVAVSIIELSRTFLGRLRRAIPIRMALARVEIVGATLCMALAAPTPGPLSRSIISDPLEGGLVSSDLQMPNMVLCLLLCVRSKTGMAVRIIRLILVRCVATTFGVLETNEAQSSRLCVPVSRVRVVASVSRSSCKVVRVVLNLSRSAQFPGRSPRRWMNVVVARPICVRLVMIRVRVEPMPARRLPGLSSVNIRPVEIWLLILIPCLTTPLLIWNDNLARMCVRILLASAIVVVQLVGRIVRMNICGRLPLIGPPLLYVASRVIMFSFVTTPNLAFVT